MEDLNKSQLIHRKKLRRAMFRYKLKVWTVWIVYAVLSMAAVWGMLKWLNT